MITVLILVLIVGAAVVVVLDYQGRCVVCGRRHPSGQIGCDE